MNPVTAGTSDRDCLRTWRRERTAESLQPVIERYLPMVHASALRRTGSPQLATDVTHAVFLAFGRRARRLRKRTRIAGWLFDVTAHAGRQLQPDSRARWWKPWRWFRHRKASDPGLTSTGPADSSSDPAPADLAGNAIAPEIDAVLDRLSVARREAVLLRTVLGWDLNLAANVLRTSERRVERRTTAGLAKATRLLRRRGVSMEAEALRQVLSRYSQVAHVPEGLAAEIQESIARQRGQRPTQALARRILRTLAWTRWRRRVLVGVPTFILLLALTAGIAWHIDARTGHSRLISMFLVWSVKNEGRTVPGLAEPARPWPANAEAALPRAGGLHTAADLYQTTNIWPAHFKFTRAQWDAIQPRSIGALPHFLQPDGTVLLRHPGAQRSGLAGVLGFDFDWSSAELEFGGVTFSNVAMRLKGNGTYLGSLFGAKHPFKVDLNKLVKGQKLAGTDELTFNNLVNDHSYVSDALAYEFFREAGVPASRTAYAYVNVSVAGQWDRRPLGLYVMVEAVDKDFALERFGSRRTPVFKPVTYQLFQHLGDDWNAYSDIYDLKTEATEAQRRRVIEFARLVSFASDAEFAGQVGTFLDLDRFARYLACEVLLSNYDGFLSNGQNFHIYLDPDSNKFGFIPWDLDLSWGGFFLLGTTRQRERASIWHPWIGEHRLLERVMAVEAFRKLYRVQLEDLLDRLFVRERLYQRIDALAAVVRGPITAESTFRLGKFEEAVSSQARERPSGKGAQGANRPAHQLKRFVDRRVASVREQLDGRSEGVIMERGGRR